MDKQIELKPCPFCGNKNIKIYPLGYKNDGLMKKVIGRFEFVCEDCCTSRAIGEFGKDNEESKFKAIETWNRRVNNG